MVSFVVRPVRQSTVEGGNLVFNVSIVNPNYAAVGSYKIFWRTNATRDDAASGNDYEAVSSLQQVIFSATSPQSFQFTIGTRTDSATEGTEYFAVDLYDFQGAFLRDPGSTVFTIQDAVPDLVIDQLKTSQTTVVAGTGISLSAAVGNVGNTAAGAFSTSFYLSTNKTIETGQDTLLTTVSTTSLARGGSLDLSRSLSLDVPPGDYWIGIVTDVSGRVGESNEANNSFSIPIHVVAATRPDLLIDRFDVTSLTVRAGGNETFSFAVRNAGDGAASPTKVHILLSEDPFLDPGSDRLLRSFDLPQLAPGASFQLSGQTTTLPADLRPGATYYIGIFADPGDQVRNEKSEANNSFKTALNVPGSTSLSIAGSSSDRAEGTNVTSAFTFTVTRTGDLSQPTTVSWSVSGGDGGAADAADFAGSGWPTGVLEFAAGQATKALTAPVQGDALSEPDETFRVTLSAPSGGATIDPQRASAIGVIRNDDGAAQGLPHINVVYPFDGAAKVSQGPTGRTSHTDGPRYAEVDFWTAAYDFAMEEGRPIYFVAPGRVVGVYTQAAGNDLGPGNLGNLVTVLHNPGTAQQFYATYAHLSAVTVSVDPNTTLPAGTVLGRSGNTGASEGPHLHFGYSLESFEHGTGVVLAKATDQYDDLIRFTGSRPQGTETVANGLTTVSGGTTHAGAVQGSSANTTLLVDTPDASALNIYAGASGRDVVVQHAQTGDVIVRAFSFLELALRGGAGADVVGVGSLAGTDIANHTVYFEGGGGTDSMNAVAADRSIVASGGEGDDTLASGAGDDQISGDDGADLIYGGAGNDRLDGGLGQDLFYGQAGRDTYVIRSAAESSLDAYDVAYDFVSGEDRVDFSALYSSGMIIATRVVEGTTFAYVDETGDGVWDAVFAAYQAQIQGPDIVSGPAGAEATPLWMFGAATDDVLVGGGGDDYLRGDAGNDQLAGGAGFDDINGNMGNDTASGGPGSDWVVGGKDDDVLFGGDDADLVYGNLGADRCEGGAGNDIVRGGQQDDVLLGGDGDDFLSGDRDSDTLSGGNGADIFHTFGDAGLDLVLDFNRAQGDRVMVDPGTAFTISQVGADTVVEMVGGGRLILVGVSMSSLSGDWIFGA